jgi:tRNA G10  N-methylase Trm11
MSHTSLFVLGRTPDLAYAELRSFYPTAQRVTPEIVSITTAESLDAHALIQQLGGTIKIAKALSHISEVTSQTLVSLLPSDQKDIHFGVSMYGASLRPAILSEMKKLLEARGAHVRYASSRHGETLSSVTVDKKHILELIVVKMVDGYAVGETQAVQSYEEWGTRDYDRPHADAKSGMLPPKVARMLVNIARPSTGALGTLVDPFCGMGTVLSEGYLTGWKVTGCDIVKEVVQKAHENLKWIKQRVPTASGEVGNIFISDAVHISDTLSKDSVMAVVTEPFMGATNIANKPHAEASEVKNIIKGLEKLYIGCLRDWAKVVQKNGVVLIALPEYAVGGRTYFVKKVIDMCEILGYTIENGPIEYSRPHATVRRKFYLFRKN